MIESILVTDYPDSHFYRFVDGYTIDGMRFRICPLQRFLSLPEDRYDLIVTDIGQLNKKPHIIWGDDPSDTKLLTFSTTPKYKTLYQPYFIPNRKIGNQIGVAKTFRKNQLEICHEDDLLNCNILIINDDSLKTDIVFAMCRSLGIQIVSSPWDCLDENLDVIVNNDWELGEKLGCKRSQSEANQRALIRAGMKFYNLSNIVGHGKQLVNKKEKLLTHPESPDALKERHKKSMVKLNRRKPQEEEPQRKRFEPFSKTDYSPPSVSRIAEWNGPKPKISVIIPMFRSSGTINELINSWDLSTPNHEVIFVSDHCPQQSHFQALSLWSARTPGQILVFDHHCGFAAACNEGAKAAKGDIVVFLNADTVVTPNWLSSLIKPLENTEIGIVGNLQLKMDGTIDSAGSEWTSASNSFEHIGRNIWKGQRLTRGIMPYEATEMTKDETREMVTGCCIALRKDVFDKVGGFDIGYRIAYWEDADLCMKIHDIGKKVFFTSSSVIYHKGSQSQGGNHPYMFDNAKRFYSLWLDSGKINKLIEKRNDQSQKI